MIHLFTSYAVTRCRKKHWKHQGQPSSRAVLQENGYQIPYTLDEYTQMIHDYMVKYPTINEKPTIGISIACSDWHWYTMLSNPSGFIANGSPDNGQWIVDEDKERSIL